MIFLQILITLTTIFNFEIHQMDVKITFLYNVLAGIFYIN